MLQQSYSDVGHSQLLLALEPERIHGLPFRKGSVNHLSTMTGISPGVFGDARGPVASHCRPLLLHPEGGRAVGRVILQHLPRLPEILRALQRHGGGPRGPEHQDEVREVELGLQVQLHRLGLQALRRLPPRVGVPERRVGHRPRQVGQEGQAGVALGTLGAAAGAVDVGVGVEAEELRAVVPAHGLGQDPAAEGEVAHAGVTGSVLTARGHTCAEHLHGQPYI